jgi:DNA mismatch endonuclease (patch repair protein)
MASIRSKDTKPERAIRRFLFSLGYRFRIHRKDLPGSPDIVFMSRKKAIFINGCFWHLHPGCSKARLPKTNQDYWVQKLERNRQRDRISSEALLSMGWEVLTIWECEITNFDKRLREEIIKFLGPKRSPPKQLAPLQVT